MAQDREKLLSERIVEADYLRKLMEKHLDVTYPDMTRSEVSINQSTSTILQETTDNMNSLLKNVHAVMNQEQSNVTLVFQGLDDQTGSHKMQSKIKLHPYDSDILKEA